MSDPQIEKTVEQLLTVLDEDSRQLENNIERLNTLRSLLIKQDKTALETLLQSIRDESENARRNEFMRQSLRQQLAERYGCAAGDMTLSYLQKRLRGDTQADIERRKIALQTLTNSLKKEYAATQMLLMDCARFNRLLLNSIFHSARPSHLTYESSGTARRQTDTLLMNMQF